LDSAQVYGKKAVGDTNYDENYSRVTLESARGGVTDKYQFNSHFSDEATVFLTSRVIDQVIAHGYTDYTEGDFGGRDAFNFHEGRVDAIIGGSFQKIDETTNGYSENHNLLPTQFTATNGSPSDAQDFALNYNLFTQWGVKLPCHFTVTVGGSMNYSEFYIENMLNSNHQVGNNPPIFGGPVKPAFTPSGSIVKMLGPNVSLYASVGMGYTPPGLSNVVNTDNSIDLGLKPESAIQYEVGSKGSVFNSKFDYDIAFYDLDITNRLIQEFVNGVGTYTNAGEQRNMGVEASLGYNFITDKNAAVNMIRPWVSYTYDQAKYITYNIYGKKGTSDTVTVSYSGNKAVGVAPNMANAGLDFGTKVGLYLHVTYQYVDKVPFTFDNEHYMSSYSLLNGRLGFTHQFGHFSFDAYGGVNNALGQTYYTSVFFAANIQDLAQSNDVNYFPKQPQARGAGGDGYILPAPYAATFYGGLTLKYTF
jgi:iron complex outermembrane recepter protein